MSPCRKLEQTGRLTSKSSKISFSFLISNIAFPELPSDRAMVAVEVHQHKLPVVLIMWAFAGSGIILAVIFLVVNIKYRHITWVYCYSQLVWFGKIKKFFICIRSLLLIYSLWLECNLRYLWDLVYIDFYN